MSEIILSSQVSYLIILEFGPKICLFWPKQTVKAGLVPERKTNTIQRMYFHSYLYSFLCLFYVPATSLFNVHKNVISVMPVKHLLNKSF